MTKKKIVAYKVIDGESDDQMVMLMLKCGLPFTVLCYGLLKEALQVATGEVVEYDGYCVARTTRTKKTYGFNWVNSAGYKKCYYYAYEI